MISKKEALILGLAVVGGLGVASMVSDGDDGAAPTKERFGRIVGTQAATAPTIYQMPAQAGVTFPAGPTFDVGKIFPTVDPKQAALEKYYERQREGKWMIDPMKVMRIQRGKIGRPSPATGIQPYLYAGGEVKLGAATAAPWQVKKDVPKALHAPPTALPKAIGIHTALEYARRPKKEVSA